MYKSSFKCSLAFLLAASLLVACQPAKNLSASDSKNTHTSQVADALGEDFRQIAQQLVPAVVSISTTSKEQSRMPDDETHRRFNGQEPGGLGSGVIVDGEKGYILTNNHVIEDAQSIRITLQNGKQYQAKVLGTDPPTDLAVLQLLQAPRQQAAVLGDSGKLRIGEWVLAIGSPFGLDSTVTAGIISAKGRADVGVADFEDFIQTDAAINPGNSGGALINTKGELIGINTAIATRTTGYMGIGFAIPSNLARVVMAELIEKGKVTRSQLGVYIGPLDEDLLKALKLPADQQGIVVMDVIEGTPAQQAGFKKYDLIVSLNGQPVREVQAFRNAIALTPPGQKVSIEIVRNGQRQPLNPQLREMDADTQTTPLTDALQERLGFKLEALSPEQKQALGLPGSFKGLMISAISAESNAYQRGLRQGDLVLEINQLPVESATQAADILAKSRPGDAVMLNIVRNGQSRIMAFEMPQ